MEKTEYVRSHPEKHAYELLKTKEVLQMPNLIEVQKDSYQWFLDEGLKEALRISLQSQITAESLVLICRFYIMRR